MKIRPVGAELFHVYRRTDMAKLNSRVLGILLMCTTEGATTLRN